MTENHAAAIVMAFSDDMLALELAQENTRAYRDAEARADFALQVEHQKWLDKQGGHE